VQGKNPFLNRVCAELRKPRPLETMPYTFRVESGDGNPYAILWFRTRGCKYDHRGECTMCNYGASTPVTPADMVEYVRQGLVAINLAGDESTTLLVSPSGSMFDEWEVPAEARRGIFALVGATACNTFICETRAEDLTAEAIQHYSLVLGKRTLYVEMGLESANPWVLKYCVNKALALTKYSGAIQLLHAHQVNAIANVLLGPAFLTQREAIADTVYSVRWAFAQGIDKCVLFSAHVKRWTLLQWLWEHDLYTPPSLWSLVEVLRQLGPQLAPRVTIAWYKVYTELEGIEANILSSPTTCPVCLPHVMSLLDAYSDTSDFAIVEQLGAFRCTCHEAWYREATAEGGNSITERVASAYTRLGQGVLGLDWWKRHGSTVLQDILLAPDIFQPDTEGHPSAMLTTQEGKG